MAERPHNFLREGVITGFIGATAIAVWFLIVDTIARHPFYTPIFLGKGVVSVLGKNMMGDTAFTHVLGYTVFHYVAFFIVGIVLTVIVHQAERTPGILAGLLVAFVMMTLGFYMIAAVFTHSALGGMSWAQIFIANLLASSLMLWYLWRKHPKLDHQLKRALEGTDDKAVDGFQSTCAPAVESSPRAFHLKNTTVMMRMKMSPPGIHMMSPPIS
jgi:hypothetical protein